MALDVYFRHDVANGITAVAVSMLSAAVAHGGGNIEYVRGIVDVVRGECEGFGIDWSHMAIKLRATLIEANRQDLLEYVMPLSLTP